MLAMAVPAAADEVSIRFQGLKLNGIAAQAPGKKWSDGALLLVHGTMAHAAMKTIADLQAALLEGGLSSLAISLGFGVDDRRGNLDCAVAHRHLIDDALPEFAAWIAWLKAQGATDITLLGHSRGGTQIARYALAGADPAVKRLVLLAPATFDAGRWATNYAQRTGVPLAKPLEQARALVATGKGDTVMEKVDFLTCPKATVSAATFVDVYADDGRKDTPALLPKIELPVLVVAAGNDQIMPDLADKMAKLQRPNLRYEMIDDADHFFLDLFAYDVAERIAAFLKN